MINYLKYLTKRISINTVIDLNNREEIKKLDPKDVYGSTGLLAKQCEQIWEDAKSLQYPSDYNAIKNIVICGMGGSAYGGHVAISLFGSELKVPLIVTNDYHLPSFVDKHSLVILTSYSGSTEETLSCAQQALQKKAKIIALTSGGRLASLFLERNLPALIFNPKYNPSGQPRLGTGYIVLGTIAILKQLGLISTSEKEIIKTIDELKNQSNHIKHKASELAKQIQGHIPVVFAAEFLGGNAHIMRNQFNETSKSFSAFSELPELNHHLMEGLKNPQDKKLTIVFITSNLYSDILKKRIVLTKDVVIKNSVPFIEYEVRGSNPISQMLSVLSFGGYITLYLGLLYGQDPSLIPWVDYFKEKLKSS